MADFRQAANRVGRTPTRLVRRTRRTLARVPGAALVLTIPHTAAFLAGSQARRRRTPTSPASPRPTARPTPALVAQVAMDEALLALFSGSNRLPKRADYERVGAEVRAAEVLWRQRGWLDDPLRYHVSPPPLLEWEATSARNRRRRFERLSFDSGYRPHPGEPGRDRWLSYLPNHTGHAWVLRHAGPPRPWLICIHGLGMGTPTADLAAFRAGRLYDDYGLNLLFPVLPLHGPRRIGRMGGDGFLSFDHLNMVHGLAQAAWDTRRLIDWARSQGATQVGLYGISLGAYTTALVSTLEPGLHSAVAGVPVVDFARLFSHHCPPAVRRRGLEHDLLGPRATAIHQVVSPLVGPSLVQRDRRFIFAGLGDRLATAGQAEALWRHWEQPSIEWFAGNHVGFMWSRQVDRYIARSLAECGLSSWQAKGRADAGQTEARSATAVASIDATLAGAHQQ